MSQSTFSGYNQLHKSHAPTEVEYTGMKPLTCIKIDGGCSKLEVFPQEVLPNTLTYLCIRNLPNLINLGEGLTVSSH